MSSNNAEHLSTLPSEESLSLSERSAPAAIRVENLSKCYRVFERPRDRLLQMFYGKHKQLYREFWALHDVSFEVERGTTVGILGRNGAGKSTLLQLICQTLAPTSGIVQVHGRVSALLELGTGFNPEFTGKENIFLNASILGLSQGEIEDRYDEIVSFADIGDFIEQPVKTYSSGMFVRLAFGVAVHVDPEVLIVDEALSVGDVKFQAKCFRKFEEFRAEGKTIILVSHAPEEIVRHCSKALLIDGGRLLAEGLPREVTNEYLDLMFGVQQSRTQVAVPEGAQEDLSSSEEAESGEADTGTDSTEPEALVSELRSFYQSTKEDITTRPGYNNSEYRWGNREATIDDYLIHAGERQNVNHFQADEALDVFMKVRFHKNISQPIYALTIKTPDGVVIYGTNSREFSPHSPFNPQKSGDCVLMRFSLLPKLITGHYLLSLGVVEEDPSGEIIPLDRRYDVIEVYVTNPGSGFGLTDLEMEVAEVPVAKI